MSSTEQTVAQNVHNEEPPKDAGSVKQRDAKPKKAKKPKCGPVDTNPKEVDAPEEVEAPEEEVEAPKEEVSAPKEVDAPKAGIDAPKAGIDAPKAGIDAPKEVDAPKAKKRRAKHDEKRVIKKRAKDPNALKKPPNAFMLFAGEQRIGIVAEHPELNVCQVSKMLGDSWGKMDESAKAPWKELALEKKKEYEEMLKTKLNDVEPGDV